MKKISRVLSIIGLVLIIANINLLASENEFLAGTAKVNITPENYELPVHDSIYVRSLVLEANGTRFAMIAIDMGGYTNPKLVKYADEKLKIDHLMLCPSHTHSSRNDRDAKELEEKMIMALEMALKDMSPVKISAGHRSFPQLGFNRLIVREDGYAREPWFGDERFSYINYERIPFGPVDPAVGVIKFDALNGKTKAVIMNYACHNDAVWGNYAISADWAGAACKWVENAFDNNVNCLFVVGAAGNIAPLFKTPGRSSKDDPFQTDHSVMERMGMHLGTETVKLIESLQPDIHEKASLKIKKDSLHFTGRFDKEQHYNVHFSTILLNEKIAIATFPGEPFIKFQLDWKEEISKEEKVTPFFFGYTWTGGKWPGYVPDIRSSAYGGYGADQSDRIIEIGAGEKIMNKQLENFYLVNGKMRSEPSNSDYEHMTRYELVPHEAIQPAKRSNRINRPSKTN